MPVIAPEMLADLTIPAPGALDRDGVNRNRAEWAQQALSYFQRVTGTDDDYAMSDLLGDLMHLARADGKNFAVELARACYHFACETHGENSAVAKTMMEQCRRIG